jgi:hypothetical protein
MKGGKSGRGMGSMVRVMTGDRIQEPGGGNRRLEGKRWINAAARKLGTDSIFDTEGTEEYRRTQSTEGLSRRRQRARRYGRGGAVELARWPY